MRKPENPQANRVNYEEENERMGVKNEIDLLLDDMDKNKARSKYDKDLVKFSQDAGIVKKEKE